MRNSHFIEDRAEGMESMLQIELQGAFLRIEIHGVHSLLTRLCHEPFEQFAP